MNQFFKRWRNKGLQGEENMLRNDEIDLTEGEMERIKLIPALEWMRGRKKRFWKWTILYVILMAILVTQVKLVYLTSESIPYKYCVQFYNLKARKGDLCVFDYFQKGKTSKFTFVKYIVGVEGDYVRRLGRKIYINDELICEVKNENGLHPIDNIKIPKGYVFVKGTHEDSLDSRYAEFGLIKEEDLKGKAIGCLRR